MKKKCPLTNWRWFTFFCWDCVFLSLSSLIISSRVSSAKSLLFGGQVHHYRHPHHQPSAIESSNQYTQILAIYKTWKWIKCYIFSLFFCLVWVVSLQCEKLSQQVIIAFDLPQRYDSFTLCLTNVSIFIKYNSKEKIG